MTQRRHPDSPLLTHCPESLPVHAYLDPDWYAREQRTVWAKNWVCAGLLNDIAPRSMRRVQLGSASAILCRASDGSLSAFHNSCRHRGAEICQKDEQPLGKLITCPYHAWAYEAKDGRLASVARAQPTADFDMADYGLKPLSITVWSGFVFLNQSLDPRPVAPVAGSVSLDSWGLEGLVTGHRKVAEMACNWKVFWENYNECLHCPGVHPELSRLVPLFGQGVMGDEERSDWSPDQPPTPLLRKGALSWSHDGALCGPVFPGLSARERELDFAYATVYPTMFVAAHRDYVRSARVEPTGPETTRVTVEWHFSRETLDQPGFSAAKAAAFGEQVVAEDHFAVELNQRGLRSPSFQRGRLMPEEYAVHDFHQWLLREMEPERPGLLSKAGV